MTPSRQTDRVGRDDPIAPDEFKKVLPTKAQLAKCVFAAELMFGLVARVYGERGMGNRERGNREEGLFYSNIRTFKHSNIFSIRAT